jgi:hypothetical protein
MEAETKACEIRLRAERRCGQLLSERKMAQGSPGNQHTGPLTSCEGSKPLANLGISKPQFTSARLTLDHQVYLAAGSPCHRRGVAAGSSSLDRCAGERPSSLDRRQGERPCSFGATAGRSGRRRTARSSPAALSGTVPEGSAAEYFAPSPER